MLQLGARFYWPEIGRFVQQDPLRLRRNRYSYAGNNPVIYTDPLGLKPYVTLTLSAGGSLAVLGLEGGDIFALDPASGQVHVYSYLGGGPGLGLGASGNVQIGLMEMDAPQALTGLGLEVTSFAAAGKGISAQVTGTGQSSVGDYAFGAAWGYAGGAGYGISGLLTYTWYQGTWALKDLPSALKKKLEPYLPQMLGKHGPCQ